MDYDTENNGLELELVIRTGGYQIELEVPGGGVRVTRAEARDWCVALKRRRCETC